MRVDSLNQGRLSTSCSATFWQLPVFRATFGDSEQFLVARIRRGTISDLKASWDWSEGQDKDQQTWRTKCAVFKTAITFWEMQITLVITEFLKTLTHQVFLLQSEEP